ncbi:cytochrome c-type biogenesis protein CcmH [Chitinibacter sp. S2-10]|uniref:cytochrome c-type biogenesis protein n=1 Tax=Chitinibacter sp. S2-10 TaxID=3373597 RepID=UPI0039779A2C
MILRLFAILLFTLSLAHGKTSPVASDATSDLVVEERLVSLAAELRCLVCQNESLASSRAPLAEDLRREVREQIRTGKSDTQIIAYLTDRYGDFVTYRPPLKGRTLLLWIGPFILLILALGIFLRGISRKSCNEISMDSQPVDREELTRLQREFEKKDEKK